MSARIINNKSYLSVLITIVSALVLTSCNAGGNADETDPSASPSAESITLITENTVDDITDTEVSGADEIEVYLEAQTDHENNIIEGHYADGNSEFDFDIRVLDEEIPDTANIYTMTINVADDATGYHDFAQHVQMSTDRWQRVDYPMSYLIHRSCEGEELAAVVNSYRSCGGEDVDYIDEFMEAIPEDMEFSDTIMGYTYPSADGEYDIYDPYQEELLGTVNTDVDILYLRQTVDGIPIGSQGDSEYDGNGIIYNTDLADDHAICLYDPMRWWNSGNDIIEVCAFYDINDVSIKDPDVELISVYDCYQSAFPVLSEMLCERNVNTILYVYAAKLAYLPVSEINTSGAYVKDNNNRASFTLYPVWDIMYHIESGFTIGTRGSIHIDAITGEVF